MSKGLKAVIFDWAGTTIDHGSRAPAIVIQELFLGRGIEVTAAQAREPMGMAKREHIAAMVAMPPIAAAWQRLHGRPCSDADIEALYREFLPLQMKILHEHADVIAGVPEVVDECRRKSWKIGSTTGYTRELIEVISAVAKKQGYEPDCAFGADDAPRGRPAPYLLFETAKRLDFHPMWNAVAVDDTPVGIEAGRNAGCWTVGVTRTGNCIGLSKPELDALPQSEVRQMCDRAAEQLRKAGAHYVVESVADIMPILEEIDRRIGDGGYPIGR